MKIYFSKKSEMTAFAKASGYEMIRCKQKCNHVDVGRKAILLVTAKNVIVSRLIRCKICEQKQNEQ